MNTPEPGNAVLLRGSPVVGLVLQTDRGNGLAWCLWPDDCGLSDCQPLSALRPVCDAQAVVQALQVIAPVQPLADPLEQAFYLNSGRSRASRQIVTYDDPDVRRR